MTPELQHSLHSPKFAIPTLSMTCNTLESKFLLVTQIRHLHKGQCEANMHTGIFRLIKLLKTYIGLCKTKITSIVKSKHSDVFAL